MPKTGRELVFTPPKENSATQLLVDENYLYRNDYGDATLTIFNKTGGFMRSIDYSLEDFAWSAFILLAGDDFYLHGLDKIFRVPTTGGALIPLVCPADGLDAVNHLAADATRLFFVGSYPGRRSQVMAIDRQ